MTGGDYLLGGAYQLLVCDAKKILKSTYTYVRMYRSYLEKKQMPA